MGFGPPVTPPIIKNLIIANAVVWLAQWLTMASGNPYLARYGPVVPQDVWGRLYLWEPFTYMWMHAPGIWHIGFNMFALWMFGSPVALAWGEKRFLRYYLVCGVGAGFVIATIPYALGTETFIPTVGASGAVMAVLLAYSFTWPDRTVMLIFPPIPLKAIWLIPLILVIELTSGPGNVSHAGHLGGVAIGWLYMAREGQTPGAPTIGSLKHRWRRYQMRQRLRAVRDEDSRNRRRPWGDDDRRLH